MDIKYFYDKGVLHSVWPPESYFGFSMWALAVPPFKPESVLLLGYGFGAIAGLIRKIWGEDFWITGVDLKIPSTNAAGKLTNLVEADAFDYVKDVKVCQEQYDYVVVDLFNGAEIPNEVWSKEFADNLARITKKMLCINTLGQHDLHNIYNHFERILTKRLGDNEILFLVPGESKENYFPPRQSA